MKKSLTIFSLTILLFSILSCNSSTIGDTPSTNAERIIRERILKKSTGYFRVISLQKTDAVENGNIYSAYYNVIIEGAKNGGYVVLSSKGNLIHGSSVKEKKDEFYLFDKRWMSYRRVEEGKQYVIEEKVTILKHENGWQEL